MLHTHFLDTAAACPFDPALAVDGQVLSYSELADQAWRVAVHLQTLRYLSDDRCLLFAYRSVSAYTGLLGTLLAGMAYVPLNPKFPPSRNAAIIENSGCRILLVDHACVGQSEAWAWGRLRLGLRRRLFDTSRADIPSWPMDRGSFAANGPADRTGPSRLLHSAPLYDGTGTSSAGEMGEAGAVRGRDRRTTPQGWLQPSDDVPARS